MNPSNQECMGRYGLGTGYFAKETDTAARAGIPAMGFCDTCPGRLKCWNMHKESVEQTDQERVAKLKQWEKMFKDLGYPDAGGRAAVQMLQLEQRPDPYLEAMLTNISAGMEARQKEGEVA